MSFSKDSPFRTRPHTLTPRAPPPPPRSQITQRGPLTFAELQSRWDTNRVDRDAFVWCDGMRDFLQIRDVPALHDALRPPPPVRQRQHPVHPPRDPAPAGAPAGGMFAAEVWKCKGANGEILGPVSAETIRAWLNYDQIDARTPVWTDGMPAYAPLRDVPALFRVVSEDAARGDPIARITHPSTTVTTEAAAPPPAPANGHPARRSTISTTSTTSTTRLFADVRSGPLFSGASLPPSTDATPSRGSTLAARFERLARLEDVDDIVDVNVGVGAANVAGSNPTRAASSSANRAFPSSRPPAMGQISSMCDALQRELRAMERERDETRARIEEEREAAASRRAEAEAAAESKLRETREEARALKAEARAELETVAARRRELEALAESSARKAAEAEAVRAREEAVAAREAALADREATLAAAARRLETADATRARAETRLEEDRARLRRQRDDLDAEYERCREAWDAVREEEAAAEDEIRRRVAAAEETEARLDAEARALETAKENHAKRSEAERASLDARAEALERREAASRAAMDAERDALARERDAVRAALGDEFRRAEETRREEMERAAKEAAVVGVVRERGGIGMGTRDAGTGFDGEPRRGGVGAAPPPPPPEAEAAARLRSVAPSPASPAAAAAVAAGAVVVPVYLGGLPEEGGARVGDVALTTATTVGSLRASLRAKFRLGAGFRLKRRRTVVDEGRDREPALAFFRGYEDAAVVEEETRGRVGFGRGT